MVGRVINKILIGSLAIDMPPKSHKVAIAMTDIGTTTPQIDRKVRYKNAMIKKALKTKKNTISCIIRSTYTFCPWVRPVRCTPLK